MRLRRYSYPKAHDVDEMLARLWLLLPNDEPLATEWRFSERGAPNLRVRGTCKEVVWLCDIYSGNVFFVSVPPLGSTLIRGKNKAVDRISLWLQQRGD